MKKIKEWFKERDNWHYLIGAILGIVFYILTFQAYQMIGRVLISVIITGLLSLFWEMYREDKYNYPLDKKDIIKSIIGGASGSVLSMIVHIIIIGAFI